VAHDVVPFSELLRARTSSRHGTSSGADFMTDLLRGTCGVDDYAQLVTQYWFVYRALEGASSAMADHPVAAPFVTTGMSRLPALESDLDFLLGDGWRDRVVALPATRAYVERLETVAAESAGAFVAHHYTRYLGGRFISTLLQKHYGFDVNGVGFYVFAEVADPACFRATYREQLDAAPWTDADKEAVVAEVALAHSLDTRLLDGLEVDRRSRRAAAAAAAAADAA
jgi:heme oxygenase